MSYTTLQAEDTIVLKDEDGNPVDKASAGLLAPRQVQYASNISTDNDSGVQDVSKWGAKEVGEWLETISLSQYAQEFHRHEISGKQLHRLTDEHLVEMQVTITFL